MQHTKHAQQITDRFRELVNDAGEVLSEKRYQELTLLVEAAIDTALMECMEKMADKLVNMSKSLRRDAEFFE